jgi:hypothetical protein
MYEKTVGHLFMKSVDEVGEVFRDEEMSACRHPRPRLTNLSSYSQTSAS